jgi:hypothetical protein
MEIKDILKLLKVYSDKTNKDCYLELSYDGYSEIYSSCFGDLMVEKSFQTLEELEEEIKLYE